MRGKKAALNTVANLLQELISVLCGLILPRLILAHFGSKYNGLTTSITQFLSCAVLLRAGLGGATKAALYKPLALHDQATFNGIVRATDLFMKKIGLLLAGMILVFAAVYPVFVRQEFGWWFSCSLFLIIGMSTFAESFFGITYTIVLQADQRLWIASLLQAACNLASTAISAVLILSGSSIHMVKLGSTVVYVLYPIVLGLVVRRVYRVDVHAKPDYQALSQRWDAFWHQVAAFVMNSTDITVLTIFSNVLEVSVYGVYNSVFHGLRRVMNAFTQGLEAAFGNMIAKEEKEILAENLRIVETLIYGVATVLYTCAAVLILDFVRVYTRGVTDVGYLRPGFAYTMALAYFIFCIRYPYQAVVQAAGHYRQTKSGAVWEAVINLSVSVLLVIRCGLIGVAVGTLVAMLFRTVQYFLYMSRHIVPKRASAALLRLAASGAEAGVILAVSRLLPFAEVTNYWQWALKAAVVFAVSCVAVAGGSLVLFPRDTRRTWVKLWGIVVKKAAHKG